uniref:Putative radical SAM superfamily protein n=1 Tax=viral metagenome TaxID=1070528 RepID=A0A6M3J016_9ZZZZ
MKLEDIGFYTLEDKRAKNVSVKSPLWRCELLLTSRCNFNCVYCRKRTTGDISFENAKKVIDLWAEEGLKNVRFSGGEPTLWPDLYNLVKYTRNKPNVKRIAISTNGSAAKELYKRLLQAGVNDFSISLDSCCSNEADKLAGKEGMWKHVVKIIEYLSRFTYVTVGMVLLPENVNRLQETIMFAINLGVKDVRVISAAQWNQSLAWRLTELQKWQYPILSYRLNNINTGRNVRGMKEEDNHQCPLVLDDMAIEGNEHYPCIIYLRERGKAIGMVGKSMRKERQEWYETHDCYQDKICKKNCLDVCIDYNNRVRELQNVAKT